MCHLLSWATERGLRVIGTDAADPGLAWHLDALGWDYTLFIAGTRLRQLGLSFGNLKNSPVFDDPARFAALVSAISEHFPIEPGRVEKCSEIPLAGLTDDATFRAFTAAWDDIIMDIRRAGSAPVDDMP